VSSSPLSTLISYSRVLGQGDEIVVGDGRLARARGADKHHRDPVREVRVEEETLTGRFTRVDYQLTHLDERDREI